MLENFYSPNGRMGRIDWLICSVLTFLIAFGGLVFMATYRKLYGAVPLGASVPMILVGLAMIWANFCLSSRRLHDIGRSAWWYLLLFVPFVGGLILFVLCLFVPGTQGTNRFGLSRSDGEGHASYGASYGTGSGAGSGLSAEEIDDLIRRHANGRSGQGGSRTAMAASGLPPQGQPVVVEKRRVPPGGRQSRPTFGRRGLA